MSKIDKAVRTIRTQGSDTQIEALFENVGETVYYAAHECNIKMLLEHVLAMKGPVVIFGFKDDDDYYESVHVFQGSEEELYTELCGIMPELSQLVLGD